MNPDMPDTASQLAEECVEKLSEHVDSVIIICTVYDDEGDGVNGTRIICKRKGNYYATKGVLTEWLEEERNRDLADKLRQSE